MIRSVITMREEQRKAAKVSLGGPMVTRRVSLQVFFVFPRVQVAGCVHCILLDAPAVYRAPVHLCTRLLLGERRGSGNKAQALVQACRKTGGVIGIPL